ncbi:AraC family transcriptional regulator [Pararcticibacter amylolyticus]|uniref:AraC family transcriptional regulator n=2 Tax=Pararcticibacter amylolyticus TaxID=2173175 RepID=A0A2U2PLK6_9SPHI|nr:AraC family transcriptional regulator [Pararcticibacter amylolyticus]
MSGQMKKSKILYSCYFARSREGEQFIPEHVFSLQIAGTLTVTDGVNRYIFKEGDYRLSRRNRLARFVKQPPEKGEFKSLSVYLDQETLRKLSEEWKIQPDKVKDSAHSVITLRDHVLYKSYMDSLLVYLQLPEDEQQIIMDLKVREAVQLLLKVNPEVKNVLFDFTEPGKIDLEAFMIQNYHFNVSLDRFAYLTGRSLATFKRDFQKIFHVSPHRWLQERRLKEAFFLLAEKKRNVSEIYQDLGFENLSHFSYAFKKHFGMAPTYLWNIHNNASLNAGSSSEK